MTARHPVLLAALLLVACAEPVLTEQDWDRLGDHRLSTLERPPDGIPPANAQGNPVWNDEAAAWLGRDLYFDPNLSGSGQVSCLTCHDVHDSGADPRGDSHSAGDDGQPSARNAPTILNASLRPHYSWFGELPALWMQIRKPLSNGFHDIEPEVLADRVCGPDSPHRLGYEHVFGPCELECTPTNRRRDGRLGETCEVLDNTARAMAAYVRTLELGESDFDRFMGDGFDDVDPDAISPQAVRGARLFVGKASCDECHAGPLFSNGSAYTLGVGASELEQDEEGHWARYQVPPLRGVTRTGPYMHDGSMGTLWDVLDFYKAGGDATPGDARPPEMQPLALTDSDLIDLEAFLDALDAGVDTTRHLSADCWLEESEACCTDPSRSRPWTPEGYVWTWDAQAGVCR